VLLLWGVGLALLTPAAVAAATGAVEAAHAGVASAVNNTARQTGGAIGIAALGALAGSPARAADFVAGLHLSAYVAAGLYVAAAAASLAAVPGADGWPSRPVRPAQPPPAFPRS
jgi:MFS transporter, DHA2 family, methylenomycin A resistance protein